MQEATAEVCTGQGLPTVLGKVCLVARSRARQEQFIQRFLFLAFLMQLICVAMPLSKFAEDLAVLARGLIDAELGKTHGFKLTKPHPQPFCRPLEFQLADSNFHEMCAR